MQKTNIVWKTSTGRMADQIPTQHTHPKPLNQLNREVRRKKKLLSACGGASFFSFFFARNVKPPPVDVHKRWSFPSFLCVWLFSFVTNPTIAARSGKHYSARTFFFFVILVFPLQEEEEEEHLKRSSAGYFLSMAF